MEFLKKQHIEIVLLIHFLSIVTKTLLLHDSLQC